MKEGWKYKALGELCDIVGRIGFRGYTKQDLVSDYTQGAITLSPSNIVNGELDFSKSTYISWAKYEESPEIQLSEGDVVLVKTASIGKCAVVRTLPHKATLNPQFVVFKNLKLNSEFLTYYLKCSTTQNTITKLAGGVAIPTLSQKKLGTLAIPLPPLSEQQRIVEYLDAAFAKIDALKAKAKENLDNAQALFQSALTEMMTPKDGWEEKTLPEISENLDYIRKPVTKGNRDAGIYPYYGASGVVDYVSDYLFDEDILLISEDGANLLARSTPIAFSVSGKVWVNNHAHVIRFSNMDLQKLVEYFFASIKLDDYVTGAAQPKLTQKNLNSIVIPVPPQSEQRIIVEKLNSIKLGVSDLQQNFDAISASCDTLKQSLLRQVFE